MADDLIALQLKMSADIAGFRKSMDAMKQTADRRLTEVEKRALTADRRLSRTMDQAGRNMTSALKNSLAGIAPVIAGAFSAAAVLRYADAYTALQNRLKATGLEGAALQRVEDSLYASANRNGVAVEATAELYQRAAMARNNLGASEQQLLALVSGTSAALKLQGTSAGEASGALLQLGQILGGEKVQAQEYNSLIDQLPVLLQAAADGSDRFGGQIAILTQKVKAGEVTTQEFFGALLKGLGDVETKAASATPTVGAAFQTLNNEIGRYVGQTDSGLSGTQRMAQGIVLLAENLDTVVLVVGALAALVGTRYVLSMTAAAGANIAATVSSLRYQLALAGLAARQAGVSTATIVATGATKAFSAALVANPIGAVLVAVTALAAGVYFLSQRYGEASILQRELTKSAADTKTAMDNYESAARAAATATGENARQAAANVSAMRTEAITALQSAQALRVRTAALAASRAEAARNEAADIRTSVGPGQTALNQGQYASAQAQAVRAQEQADQAARDAQASQRELARIDQNIRSGEYRSPTIPQAAPDRKAGGSASGPSPEDLQRQRQLLDLQAEIELLRAQGRTAEADARQDALDVLNLTKQFEDAGFQNAQAKAEAQVAAVSLAEREAKAREDAKAAVEGEQRAMALTRDFVMEMLDVQEQLALTDSDALAVRLQILAVRQAERRVALEQAAADAEATEAERQAAREALANLPTLERGETRSLQGSSSGARDARGIVNEIQEPANAVERAKEAYEEIDRLRQEDLISEQEAARAKAQVDIDLREQRLSGTRTMLDTLASLQNSSNKKIAALGKAAAIAQATIDGVLAVQKALASAPPPFNYIQAAIVGAAAAANVASIAGMADGGIVSGTGGSRQDNQIRRLSVGEFVNNAASVRKNRAFLEAANNGADLSTLIPGLARGGLVGRAMAASAGVSAARSLSSESFAYSPSIDARGSDRGVLSRVEQILEDERRALPGVVNAIRDRRSRYKLGRRNG